MKFLVVTGLSGAGISFGADRIYDVLNTLDLYPADTLTSTRVVFMNFGEQEASQSLLHMALLRREGIACEIYPEPAKMKKQMTWANTRGVPFVAMVGESELADGTITLKDMGTGEQKTVTPQEALTILQQ